MENCLSYVGSSVDKMQGVVAALDNVNNAVENIDTLSQKIASTSQEQALTAGNVEDNTKSIAIIANQTQQQADETAKQSQYLLNLSIRQKQLAEQFR